MNGRSASLLIKKSITLTGRGVELAVSECSAANRTRAGVDAIFRFDLGECLHCTLRVSILYLVLERSDNVPGRDKGLPHRV